MKTLARWMRQLFRRPRPEIDAARTRLDHDSERLEKQAKRMDDAADAIEHRLQKDAISEAVSHMLRGRTP